MRRIFAKHTPDAVMHLAAESHVDRSIEGPGAFIQIDVVGTYTLLDAAKDYWDFLPDLQRQSFRGLCVSTDEEYVELGWMPQETFESGLRKTVEWHLEHQDGCRAVLKANHTPRIAQVGGHSRLSLAWYYMLLPGASPGERDVISRC